MKNLVTLGIFMYKNVEGIIFVHSFSFLQPFLQRHFLIFDVTGSIILRPKKKFKFVYCFYVQYIYPWSKFQVPAMSLRYETRPHDTIVTKFHRYGRYHFLAASFLPIKWLKILHLRRFKKERVAQVHKILAWHQPQIAIANEFLSIAPGVWVRQKWDFRTVSHESVHMKLICK